MREWELDNVRKESTGNKHTKLNNNKKWRQEMVKWEYVKCVQKLYTLHTQDKLSG